MPITVDRFKPHPKNPNILVGKKYKIKNYKPPYWAQIDLPDQKLTEEKK